LRTGARWFTGNPTETSGKPTVRVGQLCHVTPNTARTVAAGCLIAPFVGLLWPPWYAAGGPKLAGMPFFYWYQLVWIPGSVLLMIVAFLLLRRRREAEPDHSPRRPS
jgi:hypothetical protein